MSSCIRNSNSNKAHTGPSRNVDDGDDGSCTSPIRRASSYRHLTSLMTNQHETASSTMEASSDPEEDNSLTGAWSQNDSTANHYEFLQSGWDEMKGEENSVCSLQSDNSWVPEEEEEVKREEESSVSGGSSFNVVETVFEEDEQPPPADHNIPSTASDSTNTQPPNAHDSTNAQPPNAHDHVDPSVRLTRLLEDTLQAVQELNGRVSVLENERRGNNSTEEAPRSERPCTPQGDDASTETNLDARLCRVLPHGQRVYATFLIHTGVDKGDALEMRRRLNKKKIRTFVDDKVLKVLQPLHDGSPASSMRTALETCRYSIALISREFLKKRHPCEELVYAVQRLSWMRQQPDIHWQSLIVVLMGMTVEEFETEARRSPYLRDDFCQSLTSDGVTCLTFPGGECPTYRDLCYYLAKRIKLYDRSRDLGGSCPLDKWVSFLEQGRHRDGFPKPNHLYRPKPKSMLGSIDCIKTMWRHNSS